jgi:flagellar motor switch protein FliG
MSASRQNSATAWTPPSLEELPPLPAPDACVEPSEEDTEDRSAETTSPAKEIDEEQFLSPLQQLVDARPEETGFLLHTLVVEEQQVELAAVVMLSLGRRLAGKLMHRLDEEPQRQLVRAIAALDHIEVDRRRKGVEEFTRRLRAEAYSLHGGREFARQVLEEIADSQGAQKLFEQFTDEHSQTAGISVMLKNATPEQISPFISQEHPQTGALILSQLEPVQAADILSRLPEHMQADIAYRIATMENITSAVLRQIEEHLESSLREILGGSQGAGGMKAVADILNLSGANVEQNVLGQFDDQDLEIAERVRNLMFAFEDITGLTNPEIQLLLEEIDQKDLVIALKTASDEMKDKVLNNMSERVRAYIAEEMEFLGRTQSIEVEEAQLRIVQQVRQLEEQGKLTIARCKPGDPPV